MIGGGVATCFARHNCLTSVYDVRAEAASNIAGAPSCAASPAEVAADCDIIFIAVINAQQVKELLIGEHGLFSASAKKPLTLILLSTVAINEFHQLSAIAAEHGAKLFDCGVTGGPDAAPKGDLVCLVGSDENDYKELAEVLSKMSKASFLMGPPGAGMAAKIARNIVVYTSWMAGQEAARLASAAGVNPATLAEVINSSDGNIGGPTTWLTRPNPNESEQEQAIRQGVLGLLQKDLSAALELGEQLKVSLPGAVVALDQGAATLAID